MIGWAADLAPGPVASPCAASDCYAGMSCRASNGLDARCGHGEDATFRHHETAFGVVAINTWFHHGMREAGSPPGDELVVHARQVPQADCVLFA